MARRLMSAPHRDSYGSNPRPVHVGFVVNTVAREKVVLRVILFFSVQ
jgi:hypothetical protein